MEVNGKRHVPAALYPWERALGTQWIGDWVDLRAGLNTEARAQVRKLWGALLVLWGGSGRLYAWNIYFQRNMGARWNIYFDMHFAWLKYFTYRLIPALARRLKLQKYVIH
jgi:hypothetical protein